MIKAMLLPINCKLFLVFKILGLNGYLKSYLKTRMNKLSKKKKKKIANNCLLANADLLKISVFYFFHKTYLQKPIAYVIIKIISSNKT